jgi:hypothetical protein
MSDLTDRLRDGKTVPLMEERRAAADEIDKLRVTNKMLMDDKADLLRDQQRKIGALARYHIETQLVDQLLEEGPNTETTSLDMEYWNDQHDQLKAALTERDALRQYLDAAQRRGEKLRERHRLEMAGIVQVIATHANNLQNFAGNLDAANAAALKRED